jgi:hypothetical protein
MIGEYTMNEYKAYKALVKHKRRINRVFSEVCGDKSFNSRCSGRKLKIPAVAVASCSAAPISSPRRRSSKRGPSIADETTSFGVQPSKTRSLESSKRKCRSFEQVSDAELPVASGLAQMSRKKSMKAVKKVVSSGVRWVPSDSNLLSSRFREGTSLLSAENSHLLRQTQFEKVTLQNLSRQGSIIFVNSCTFELYEFLLKILIKELFRI